MDDSIVRKRHKRLFILGVVLLIALTIFFGFIIKEVSSQFLDKFTPTFYPHIILMYGFIILADLFVYIGAYVLFVIILLFLTCKNTTFMKIYIIIAIVGLIISLIYGINTGFLSKLDWF
jgi:hypothetical protein